MKVLCSLVVVLTMLSAAPSVLSAAPIMLSAVAQAGMTTAQSKDKSAPNIVKKVAPESVRKIAPGRLLVRPKSAKSAPKLFDDPKGWIRNKQRYFYNKMARMLQRVRHGDRVRATWSLIMLSFIYGILHAAGPGHGKAVVSAWLLANEQQLKRGVIIASMASFIQAATAVVIVTSLFFVAHTAGTKARFLASSLEAVSFGLIALTGVYLIWRTLKRKWQTAPAHTHNHNHNHTHNHNHEHNHAHSIHAHHEHDENCSSHKVETSCDCGHAHMPDPQDLANDWSWGKAIPIAFSVGIRPCSGAILVLLLSSSIGLYWVGVVSTFAMAIGTGITVSFVAVLTVTSKNLAMRLTGNNSAVFDKYLFAVNLLAGIFIMLTGGFLFWVSIPHIVT